jgi:hypothetical protein
MADLVHKSFLKMLNELASQHSADGARTVIKQLALDVDCSQSTIRNYLEGKKITVPSEQFVKTLNVLLEGKSLGFKALVLAKYLQYLMGHQKGKTKLSAELFQAAVYLEQSLGVADHKRFVSDKPLYLSNFPDAFYPLTIVCGDRRDGEAKDWTDLFISSMSPLDLMYLPRLGLPEKVEVAPGRIVKSQLFTDRIFSLWENTDLREKFYDYNLLVVGSPRVNGFARMINFASIFRFALSRRTKSLNENLRQQKMLRKANLAQAFGDICRTYPRTELEPKRRSQLRINRETMAELLRLADELLGSSTLSQAVEMFYPSLISDPTAMQQRQRRSNAERLGVVSLAPSPFNSKKVCIFAAGVDGIATAHCVRALAYAKEQFAERPLGCVMTIRNTELLENPENAWFEPLTEPYTLDSMDQRLTKWMNLKRRPESWDQTNSHFENTNTAFWSDEEIVEAKEFISRLRQF